MSRPVVRAARPSDAAAIAAVQVRSWQVAYRGIVPDGFLDDLAEDAWLERWNGQLAAEHDGVHQLVAADAPDGPPRAIAACGSAWEPEPGLTAQLYVLYADPGSWGQGYGSALLRRVHELLSADGHAGGVLWVAERNERAITFYERHGWVRDGRTQREEVAGAVFDELRMVRDLRDRDHRSPVSSVDG